jgi:protein SCO1/2
MKLISLIRDAFVQQWPMADGRRPTAVIRTRTKGHRPTALLVAIVISCITAHAQFYNPPQSSGQPAGQKPAILNHVGLDQKLNSALPLTATFRDERGNPVELKQFFGSKPAILTLVYYQCPMLCTEVLNGLSSAISPLKLNLGRDYQIITISIDPTETPAMAEAKKEKYIARYGRPGADQGWHFLTGNKQNIDAVANAVGFRYAYDPSIKQFAHPSTIMVVTSDGNVAQYYTGIEYEPKDLRLALVEASQNRIGNVVDRALLFCYHYDPAQGRYTPKIMALVRAGGALTLTGMILMIGMLFHHERKRSKAA